MLKTPIDYQGLKEVILMRWHLSTSIPLKPLLSATYRRKKDYKNGFLRCCKPGY
jgi:hypothetical protein